MLITSFLISYIDIIRTFFFFFFRSGLVRTLARKYGKTAEQIFFRFVKHLDILPLSGTTNLQHMEEDLAVPTFSLQTDEVQAIESLLMQ